MNSDDDVRQKTGSTHGMSDTVWSRRVDCENCDGVARGALPQFMDDLLCRQCREDARDA